MARKLAPRGTNLPSYRPEGGCPKCGGVTVGTHYVAGDSCDEQTCRTCDQEHLARTCRLCGFAWAEATVDNADPIAEWEMDLMERSAREHDEGSATP